MLPLELCQNWKGLGSLRNECMPTMQPVHEYWHTEFSGNLLSYVFRVDIICLHLQLYAGKRLTMSKFSTSVERSVTMLPEWVACRDVLLRTNTLDEAGIKTKRMWDELLKQDLIPLEKVFSGDTSAPYNIFSKHSSVDLELRTGSNIPLKTVTY